MTITMHSVWVGKEGSLCDNFIPYRTARRCQPRSKRTQQMLYMLVLLVYVWGNVMILYKRTIVHYTKYNIFGLATVHSSWLISSLL